MSLKKTFKIHKTFYAFTTSTIQKQKLIKYPIKIQAPQVRPKRYLKTIKYFTPLKSKPNLAQLINYNLLVKSDSKWFAWTNPRFRRMPTLRHNVQARSKKGPYRPTRDFGGCRPSTEIVQIKFRNGSFGPTQEFGECRLSTESV